MSSKWHLVLSDYVGRFLECLNLIVNFHSNSLLPPLLSTAYDPWQGGSLQARSLQLWGIPQSRSWLCLNGSYWISQPPKNH